MRSYKDSRRSKFVERIDVAYEDARRLGSVNAGGVVTWFAEQTGIDKAAVSRMRTGDEPIHGYAWGSLRLVETVNELRERALKAESNASIVLLQDAAEEARQESERLQRKIDVLRDLCDCPRNRHDNLESIDDSMRERVS